MKIVVALVLIAGCNRGALPGGPEVERTDRASCIRQLTSHWNRSCVLTVEGELHCWGGAPLGDGGWSEQHTPTRVVLDDVAEIALGGYAACARTRDGAVRCWGANLHGAVGTPRPENTPDWYDNVLQPTRVFESSTHVAAGDYTSCATDAAGALYCWGRVLGDDGVQNQLAPRRLPIDEVRSAAISAFGTCAIKGDRSLHCWGEYLVGDGSEGTRLRPVPILDEVAQVTQGVDHTCALAVDGTVSCWGVWNIESWNPAVPVRLDDAGDVVQVANGESRICVVRRGGALECKHKDQGPLARVPLEGVVEVAPGNSHACARTRDDRIYCWGKNDHGQLGDGTTIDRDAPVPVAFSCR